VNPVELKGSVPPLSADYFAAQIFPAKMPILRRKI